ncbi:2'-deoxycytidine 5'-triphosphate deaminase [Alphaproteobacteria bacterium LSUCC0684]
MPGTSPSHPSFPAGILAASQLEEAVAAGIIRPGRPITTGQIQPASIDLRLGARAWRIKASFLPGEGVSVAAKLDAMAMHEIDLSDGAVLEKGCVYIARLEESLDLPAGLSAFANPKSSTGRLDVFTRMIADGATEFETAPQGYSGPLYAEISPRTFSILARQGSRLSQLRLRQGESRISDAEMQRLQEEIGLVHGGGLNGRDIRDGVPLSVDLSGRANPSIPGLVGWRARKHAGLIDVDRPGAYPVAAYWEKVTTQDLSGGGLVLNPDEFYILVSRECVTVPPAYAAEMSAYDTRVGEFRAHYAGFFDPGFGMAELGAPRTRAVLEVRSHDVPFLIEEGQTVCRLVYEPLSAVPETLYGAAGSGSHYQAQGLQLAKHFQPPEETHHG